MKHHNRFADEYRRMAITVFTVAAIIAVFFLVVATANGAEPTAVPQQSVVSNQDIQSAIDGQRDRADADRQAIQAMLQRADVRQVAGAAGLDLERASAAAAVLAGPSLEMLAAQARTVNAGGVVGGEGRVVITTTGIIIILLILILLLN